MTTSPAFFDNEALTALVAENLASVKSRIAATGRAISELRVVAVTKGFPASHAAAAIAAGADALGENYSAELLAKRASLGSLTPWHYLGTLQTNKIPQLSHYADLLATVSRAREVEALARQNRRPPVYLQIDFTGRAQRNGVDLEGLGPLVTLARERGLDVRGLMTVAPTDPAAAAVAFRALVRAADEFELVERSMGMSGDFELACQLGSTEIRVGLALFGARPGA